jgi:hypothetical protein
LAFADAFHAIMVAFPASWLNQVEVWFSILSAKALAGASFTSPRQVRDQIDAFIKAYNQTAHPFEWTKQVVFSQHPRRSIHALNTLTYAYATRY